MKTKIFVIIQGGIVQGFTSSDTDMELQVLDIDHHAEEVLHISEPIRPKAKHETLEEAIEALIPRFLRS